jgi:hypothetical protein
MAAGGAPSHATGGVIPAIQPDPAELIVYERRMRDIEFRIKKAEFRKIQSDIDRNKSRRDDTPSTAQGEKSPFFIVYPEVQTAKSRFPGVNLV